MYPITRPLNRKAPHPNARKSRKQRKANNPALTSFLRDKDALVVDAAQPQSRLLSLPKELRLEIWEWVLGGHIVSMGDLVVNKMVKGRSCYWYSAGTRVHHTQWSRLFTALLQTDGAGAALHIEGIDEGDLRPGVHPLDQMDLSALTTCREIYRDAWDGPFKWNVFSAQNLTTLIDATASAYIRKATFLPHQTNAIVHIVLQHNRWADEGLRNVISRQSMGALKNFRLVVNGVQADEDKFEVDVGSWMKAHLPNRLHTPELATVHAHFRFVSQKDQEAELADVLKELLRNALWTRTTV